MSAQGKVPMEPRSVMPTPRMAAQGAMLEEYRSVVHLLQPETAREDARRVIIDENVLRRDSIGGRTWVFKKLGLRYYPRTAPRATEAFTRAAQLESDPAQVALLAYTMIAWQDGLVYLLGSEWLVQKLRIPDYAAKTADILDELDYLASSKAPVIGAWSKKTLDSVAAHYLSLLRDCGFATGSLRKEIRSPYVSVDVVLFGTRLILGGGESAAAVPEHSLFKVLGLTPGDVIDALTELNAEGRIAFAVQGNVAHIALKEAHAN